MKSLLIGATNPLNLQLIIDINDNAKLYMWNQSSLKNKKQKPLEKKGIISNIGQISVFLDLSVNIKAKTNFQIYGPSSLRDKK